MKMTPNVAAMVALAAVLSVPAALAAQAPTTTTAAPTAGAPAAKAPGTMTTPPAAAMPTPRTTATAGSTYMTADAQVRASKIVGAGVYNDQDQKIGSVDDVLMRTTDGPSSVVLSVGGFLGMGSKLVEVPYSQIQVTNDKLVMTGATKQSLTSLPEYKYTSKS